MSDIMRPVPFKELLERIFSEYKQGSIFGIQKENFFFDNRKKKAKIFSQECSTVLGPAAGPHTQLAQNIIASFLTGSRFIELKTVQIMDRLEIEKPCIDARDEGFNVEWSTEYTLYKARKEYYKAWIICNFLDSILFGQKKNKPNFIFNMSVGYNLEGIKNPRMQEFIDCMMDASEDEDYNNYIAILREQLVNHNLFNGCDLEEKIEKYFSSKQYEKIPANICKSVTISTMHGCPPKEIEAICSYMLTEKKIDTFVKLNPTLLGYDEVRRILDATGYNYVELKHESFDHDLQYNDAIAMLKRLKELAKKNKKCFGIKLTNTLGNVNDKQTLPGDERYMSGRSLYPLATALAAKISKVFDGKLPISYSGGVNIFNVAGLFEAGIKPITLATDMLHPGGYNKMKQMADLLAGYKKKYFKKKRINVSAIEAIAENAIIAPFVQKSFRGLESISVDMTLPRTDCFISPCEVACPVNQTIVNYVKLGANGGDSIYDAMLELRAYNSLPYITCEICNHACQSNCTRMDYEGQGVEIRQMKKYVVENAAKEYENSIKDDTIVENGQKVAVVGAGPSGLASAISLREYGYDVTVFEKEAEVGGVVRYVIPDFRISREAITNEYNHALSLGVKFEFGVAEHTVTVAKLRENGYQRIFYCVGTEKERELRIDNATDRMCTALKFLRKFKETNGVMNIGKNVVIIGGGNTAMDAARAALKVNGVESATILYRKIESDMPADREEIAMAKEDGVKFVYLASPKSHENGELSYYVMQLKGKDSKGRNVTEAGDETATIACDYVITAAGEMVDINQAKSLGLPITEEGALDVNKETFETSTKNVYAVGDLATGPRTVISCVASAATAAANLLSSDIENSFVKLPDDIKDECTCEDDNCECHCHDDEATSSEEVKKYIKSLMINHGRVITDSIKYTDSDFAKKVGESCLDCQTFCGKCVDVCPNRANVVIDVSDEKYGQVFGDYYQIIHLDAYCNECGNCASFCPYKTGRPYKDKFTIFSREDDIRSSTNDGFYLVDSNTIMIRDNSEPFITSISRNGDVSDSRISDETKTLIKVIFTDYNYLLGKVEE